MTLPALPNAQALSTPEEVDAAASQIEEWADQTDDIGQVRELQDKWAALTEYIRRKSRQGVARAEAAERHIENRLGCLIKAKRDAGELAPAHRPSISVTAVTLTDLGISRRQAADFVAMAEHPDIVEQVIARSDDESPPSRRKVIDAIRSHKISQMAEEARQGLIGAGVKLGADPGYDRFRTEIVAGLHGRLRDLDSYGDRFDYQKIADAVVRDRLGPDVWITDIESAINWLDALRTTIINTKENQ